MQIGAGPGRLNVATGTYLCFYGATAVRTILDIYNLAILLIFLSVAVKAATMSPNDVGTRVSVRLEASTSRKKHKI